MVKETTLVLMAAIAQARPNPDASFRRNVHIFVDDAEISEKSGIVRRAHPCKKSPSPVLEPEMPWEKADDERVYLYGTVLRDPSSGSLSMWYNRIGTVLYATSQDGVLWKRPILELHAYQGTTQNNVVFLDLHSPSVLFDTWETDPKKRYKMLGYSHKKEKDFRGYCAAYSGDGLHWILYPKNPVLPHGDTCTLCALAATREYLAFHKIYREWQGHKRRLVYLAVSKDMQHWSEPQLVMAPDEIDDEQTVSEGGLWSEFYNMSAFPYAGQFLGLITHFRYKGAPKTKGRTQSPHDGPIDVQLVHSRDGKTWHRCEDRSPVIPNGPYAYDAGCILGVGNGPVIMGDEMWIYYTGITTTHGGYVPEKRITIARGVWRVDGLVSLYAGDASGWVETTPLDPKGDTLTVNADGSKGELRVALLDEDGNALPSYEVEDCIPVTTDSVRHRVHWKSSAHLPEGKPFRIRFYIRSADLYSYSFF